MRTHQWFLELTVITVGSLAWGCGSEGPSEVPIGSHRQAITEDCPPGYHLDDAGTCVDIDECVTDNGGCHVMTTCMNLAGGRDCGPCPDGYEGTGDTFCMVPFTASELVGRPTDRAVTINVMPGQDLEVYFEYGRAPGNYTESTAPTTSLEGVLEVVVDGLSPDTLYYYRMRYRPIGTAVDFRAGEEHTFQTQRGTGSAFTFAVQSDSHQGYTSFHSDALYRTTMANIASDHPDFLVDLGDTISLDDDNETAATVGQKYLNQRNVFGIAGHSTPVFLALGNHENEEGWNLDDKGDDIANSLPILGANARKRYFLNPVPDGFYSGNDEPVPQLDGDKLREDYYAFEWGRALFVIIDPFWYTTKKPFGGTMGGEKTGEVVGDRWDWTLGDKQYQWLKRVLEGSNDKFKFVFAHQMTGGVADYVRAGAKGAKFGEWGGYDIDGVTWAFGSRRPGWEMPIHDLFVKNNVSAFFHGHDHFYAKEVLDGIVYQEVPHAANPDYGAGFTSNETDYEGATQVNNSGYLRVTVDATEAQVEYVRSYLPDDGANGEVADSYTMVFCNQRDSDGDNHKDCGNQDACPGDTSKLLPGACGCGSPDIDSDGDGVLDCRDGCPSDPAKVAVGLCGCGQDDAAGCARFMVTRVGDVGSALTLEATRAYIEERRLDDGTLLNVTPLPKEGSGANWPLTVSGSAPVEGTLKRSVDGHFVTLAGFGVEPGYDRVAFSASSDVSRVVARIAADHTIDTSTALTTAFSGSGWTVANDRAVATLDGTGFWVAGAGANNTGGIWYVPFGTVSATQIIGQSGNNPNSTRGIGIFGGQLYSTNNAQTFRGVFTVGTGLPTAQATATMLPGFPTSGSSSPVDFAVLDRDPAVSGVDTVYVADDRTDNTGGVQKWTFNGTTWTLAYTLSLGSGIGARHLFAVESPDGVMVLATTTSTPNAIVRIVDTGSGSGATTIATAQSDTAFRGVALSPEP